MTDVYNLSGIIASPDIATLATGMNTILGGYYYGYFIILSVCFVTFLYLKTKGYMTRGAFAATSWMAALMALFLRPMGLIDNYTFWLCVILVPFTLFVLILLDESN